MQVLLLGGHGKVALHLTPLLLQRAWSVTSLIRNPAHESEILALGKGLKGNINVLLSSLEDVKSAADAQKIIDTVSPDYVIWAAGKYPQQDHLPTAEPTPLYKPVHTAPKPATPNKRNNPKPPSISPITRNASKTKTNKRRRGRQRRTQQDNRYRPRSRQTLHDRLICNTPHN